jgi:hypothetical protein
VRIKDSFPQAFGIVVPALQVGINGPMASGQALVTE